MSGRVGGQQLAFAVGAPAAPGAAEAPTVEVRRSRRRRRTVSAYRDGDTTVVLLPASMTRAEEAHWVEVMLGRLAARERRSRPTNADLAARARRLSDSYLAGRARPASVRWVDNQESRWGSCTPADGTIRLSSRLQAMPTWVTDYVLIHELAHLLEPDHSPQFWALVAAYPRTDRARGFLDGYTYAERQGSPDTGAGPGQDLDPDVDVSMDPDATDAVVDY